MTRLTPLFQRSRWTGTSRSVLEKKLKESLPLEHKRRLQQLREDAEKARAAALVAQHAAAREREEYERKAAELDREAKQKAALQEMRAALRPNEVVRVSRFDTTGKVVRVDAKKQTVTVSVGLGQWEIPFEEIFPADK